MNAHALPILYSFRRCPYAMRARLALAHAGLACELREINLRDKPQALLDVSPKGTVPVLVLQDGRVIEQSLDIMLHALQANDPDGWLAPTQGTLDEMLALIARNDNFSNRRWTAANTLSATPQKLSIRRRPMPSPGCLNWMSSWLKPAICSG